MPSTTGNSNRIVIADAIRGLALLGIMVLHSVNHFNFYTDLKSQVFFSDEADEIARQLVNYLINGKANSIFALMFGFSFFIQAEKGKAGERHFQWKFLWRLCILFAFGLLHGVIFRGDIL